MMKIKLARWAAPAALLVCFLFSLSLINLFSQPSTAAAGENLFEISAATLLAGADVRGARIQADGTVVLAANLNSDALNGVTPTLLNGATAASDGAIVRLSTNGRSVRSVTRVGDRVLDLAIDANDNIVVSLWQQGVLALTPEADGIRWQAAPGNVLRVDAGNGVNGETAVLVTTSGDPDSSSPGSGTILLYEADGDLIDSFAGRHNTLDVCLDDASQTVNSIGWRQASVSGTPVQIAYLRGAGYDGSEKWNGYDWSTDSSSPDFINAPTSNMADTRGYRCDIGADGKLYAAYEAAGGNHIFRYLPFDINARASIVGGDRWQEFFNTASEHKTFFAKYEPSTGAYLLGQQITNRLTNNRGNTIRVRWGTLTADANGQVYIGGQSAWGLPLPAHPNYSPRAGETAFDPPGTSDYLGGAWFMVFDETFALRRYTTRLTGNGNTFAADGRVLRDGEEANIVFAGRSGESAMTYSLNGVGTGMLSDDAGWAAVIAPVAQLGAVARFTVSQDFAAAPLTVALDGSSSFTSNSSIENYMWNFGDGNSGTGATVSHTYATDGVYTITLTVMDNQMSSDSTMQMVIAGGSRVYLPFVMR